MESPKTTELFLETFHGAISYNNAETRLSRIDFTIDAYAIRLGVYEATIEYKAFRKRLVFEPIQPPFPDHMCLIAEKPFKATEAPTSSIPSKTMLRDCALSLAGGGDHLDSFNQREVLGNRPYGLG